MAPFVKEDILDELIINEMLEVYKPTNKDWLGYDLTNSNRLEIFYINQNQIQNTEDLLKSFCFVSKDGKNKLEIIKQRNPNLYKQYIFMLGIINSMNCPPTFEIRIIMNGLRVLMEDYLKTQKDLRPRKLKRCIFLKMKKIFATRHKDWLGYDIKSKNKLTCHHIVEYKNGGETCFDNTALLTETAHNILNCAEAKDYHLYRACNEFFKKINKSRKPLSEELKLEALELKQKLEALVLGNKTEVSPSNIKNTQKKLRLKN